MSDDFLVFDAVSIREITPEPYDPNVYGYRYANGSRAETLPDFERICRELKRCLSSEPRTARSLSDELNIELRVLQQILDYLFTHTGDVAALELPGHESLYMWAGISVAEDIRTKLLSRGVSIDTRNLRGEDISALSAYITNLIALNPPAEVYDAAIEKCRTLLDAARVLYSIQRRSDVRERVRLLEKKLGELIRRRDSDRSRWSESGTDRSGDAVSTELPKASSRPAAVKGRSYPFTSAYLLGPSYTYSGPGAEKRFRAEDPGLHRFDFSSLRKLIVEIDTFATEIDSGTDVLELIERHIGSVFPRDGLVVVFRKIPGLAYGKRLERRFHKLGLDIRKRGYELIENRGA